VDERYPWLDSYPEDVPAEINPDIYQSLSELLVDSAKKHSSRPAFSNSGVVLHFEKIEKLSRDFAAFLQSDTTLKPGDRVAVMLPNLLQYPVVTFGILRAGMVVVNVNPLYTERELEHQLSDSGAKMIVVLENFASVVAAIWKKVDLEMVVVTEAGDHFSPLKRTITNLYVKYFKRLVPNWKIKKAIRYLAALDNGNKADYKNVEINPEDTAFLQYTGGTTGAPKGAVLTHRNMISNVLQASAWVSASLDGQDDVVVTPLPLYHVFSLTANLLCFFNLGAHNVLVTNPRNLESLLKDLKRWPFTFITGVNTLFVALLNCPGFSKIDFSRHKVSMGGGSAVQRSVSNEWHEITGRPLAQGYGLTEASPIVSATLLNCKEFNGSVGLPLPSTEVVICGEDGGCMSLDEVGEICIRGPQVMKEYWKNPVETVRVLSEDGWLKTGDVGRIDKHGYLYIEDRKKDLILVSGFNVYPSEIEEVMASHPGVLEAAAVGIPDDRTGEAVKLFITKKHAEITKEQLMEYCCNNLTGYKRPKEIVFSENLPKNNVGKVLRRVLRE
tara:strand:+ start:2956 stop:4620 length:1665 start_codon:yes stop_codon:yes gene_type:complete